MKIMRTLAAVFALGASSLSFAGDIAVDGSWYGFCFGEAGGPATPGCNDIGYATEGNSFTFTTTTLSVLKVTDAFLIGDSFDVYVNNAFAFTTSMSTDGSYTRDPDVAFASGYYSSGSLNLSPGSYSVDVFANASPHGGGGGYLAVSPVPESTSAYLFMMGLASLGFLRKHKENQTFSRPSRFTKLA